MLNAFARIQMRPTEILTAHIQAATMELNLLFARMNNMGPNLWTVDLQTLPLTQGVATYQLPAETIMITNMYIRTGATALESARDRILWPISQTEYDSLANKNQQGFPNQFWFNRTISPTVTFYLVPDGNGPYTCYYHRVRNIQDATLAQGKNIEVPVLWLDALAAGLAHRLARIFAPQLEQLRKLDADEAWKIAADQNVENVPLLIAPGLWGYYAR